MAAFRLFRSWLFSRPHERVGASGRRLGRIAHRVLGSKRKLALANLDRVLPQLSDAQRAEIVKKCFEHFGSYFFEVFSSARLDSEELASRFEIRGLDRLEAALDGDRGVFLTAGHYGSWELAMFPLARWATARGRTVHAVARPMDNPQLDAAVRGSRQRFGIQIIDKAGAAHRMLNAYRRGGLVAIVIDQHVRPSAGIQVPFFGAPAWTSPVLATLSLRTGAAVVPFTCLPAERAGTYELTLHEAIEPIAGSPCSVQAESEMTRRYLESVEKDILRQPEYWLWMHRRWR